MPLRAEDKEYTAFTLPGVGQFEWNTSPMGLTGCPASFARLMDMVMKDLPNVITYIDDILIHTPNHAAQVRTLEAALLRLRQHNLKVNLHKCILGSTSVPYLGHRLTAMGIQPGIDKTQALAATKFPRTLRQMRAFLGLANYFRSYVPNFARLAATLYATTRSNFQWGKTPLPEDAYEAFGKIKKILTESPLLAYPNREGRFHLYVDAALGDDQEAGGLGAALFQTQPDGSQKPVAYASRQLQPHEKNYSPFLLELRAVVYGLESFHHHVFGKTFTVYTDHKPLTNLSKVHSKTLNRLQEEILKYHFQIKHIPGKENPVADYLSRSAYGDSISAVQADQIAEEQRKAEVYRSLIQAVREGHKPPGDWSRFPGEFIVYKDTLYFQPNKRNNIIQTNPIKTVIPPSLTKTIVSQIHNSEFGGHAGYWKTRSRIRELYWWPTLDRDVERLCATCTTCNRVSNKYHTRTHPTVERDMPDGPNHRVHVDLFGPLQSRTEHGKSNRYVMVMTDAFTKMAILRVIPNKTATVTAETFMSAWCYTFGIPRTVITDQGNEFKGQFEACIKTTLQAKHITTTPYHPQSNGQAEVFNRTMGHYLRAMIEDCNRDTLDWEQYIMPLQFSYNTAIHKTIMTTPFYALYGYDPNVPLWQRKDKAVLDQCPTYNDTVARVLQVNHRVQQYIRDRLPKVREQQDAQYNKRHNTQPYGFKVNDRVWIRRVGMCEPNPKLSSKWEEGVIICLPRENTATVSRYNRRKHKEITVHVDKLRPMLSATPPEEEMENTTMSDDCMIVDLTDKPILERLYQGRATKEDVTTLLQRGYAVVFPHGTLYPQNAPNYTIQDAPSQPPPLPELNLQKEEEHTRIQSQATATTSKTLTSSMAPKHKAKLKHKDKLSRLARQLDIPATSSFRPIERTIPRTVSKQSGQIQSAIRKMANTLTPPTMKQLAERDAQRLKLKMEQMCQQKAQKETEKATQDQLAYNFFHNKQ